MSIEYTKQNKSTKPINKEIKWKIQTKIANKPRTLFWTTFVGCTIWAQQMLGEQHQLKWIALFSSQSRITTKELDNTNTLTQTNPIESKTSRYTNEANYTNFEWKTRELYRIWEWDLIRCMFLLCALNTNLHLTAASSERIVCIRSIHRLCILVYRRMSPTLNQQTFSFCCFFDEKRKSSL